MREWAERLRLIAAVLLIGSLCLPVSRCTYQADANGRWVSEESAQQNPAAVHEVVEYQYALSNAKPAPERWLTLAYFVLPLAMVAVLSIVRQRRWLVALRSVEVAGVGFSCWGLFSLALFGEFASGGYLAAASLAIYLLAMLTIDVILLRDWWHDRKQRRPA